MANYYSDHPEIGFYLNHPLMARIVELKEKGFADAKEYDYVSLMRKNMTTHPLTWVMRLRTTSRFSTSLATWLPTSSLLTRRMSTSKVRTSRTDV